MQILILSMSFRIIYHNNFMIISVRIKELRTEAHLTQKQLAEKVGCNQSMVARWENGQCEPTAGSILKLSEIFGCSTDYLFGKSEY